MRSKQRFGKADAAGISVVQVQVWFEKFPDVGRYGILQTSWGKVCFERTGGCRRRDEFPSLTQDHAVRICRFGSGRTFADGCAKVAAVAHQEKRGHRFERMQQAEHSALPFAYGERKRFEELA